MENKWLNLNKEKLDETGKVLNVDSSDIQKSKSKQILKKLIFPLVQVSTIILSATSGALLGYLEKKEPSGYPYAWDFPKIYFFGPMALLGFSTGNILISSKNYKKTGLRGTSASIIVFLSIVISVASLVFIYMAVQNPPPPLQGYVPPFNVSIDYDTFRKRNL